VYPQEKSKLTLSTGLASAWPSSAGRQEAASACSAWSVGSIFSARANVQLPSSRTPCTRNHKKLSPQGRVSQLRQMPCETKVRDKCAPAGARGSSSHLQKGHSSSAPHPPCFLLPALGRRRLEVLYHQKAFVYTVHKGCDACSIKTSRRLIPRGLYDRSYRIEGDESLGTSNRHARLHRPVRGRHGQTSGWLYKAGTSHVLLEALPLKSVR
jgi:hypothetical protein